MSEFQDACDKVREEIKGIDAVVLELKEGVIDAGPETLVEIRDCLQMSHRYLEDARMRIGKALQAYDGGRSILDHPEVQSKAREVQGRDPEKPVVANEVADADS